MTTIYVIQHGAWWKLPHELWHSMLEGGCLGYEHELPARCRLSRRPPLVEKVMSDGPDSEPTYAPRRDDVLVYSPVDWGPDDYFAALCDLDGKLAAQVPAASFLGDPVPCRECGEEAYPDKGARSFTCSACGATFEDEDGQHPPHAPLRPRPAGTRRRRDPPRRR
jgi:hypothetical protein